MKALLFATLALLSDPSGSERGAALNALTLMHDVPLGKSIRLGKAKGFSWVEYCPDNTCEVIRSKAVNSDERLLRLFAGYLMFVSGYSYLKPWQMDSSNHKRIAKLLASNQGSDCGQGKEPNMAKCELLSLTRELSAELLFVRFDEGQASVSRINLPEEIGSGFQSAE